MFFIAYAFKGQVHAFAGRVKIVSHSSCRTSAIFKYFVPWNICSRQHFQDKNNGRIIKSFITNDQAFPCSPVVSILIGNLNSMRSGFELITSYMLRYLSGKCDKTS